MKKITLGCAALFATAIFIVGCNKDKTNTPPEQDTEFQSSKDVTYANLVAADLEIICSYMGENLLTTDFFKPAPGSAPGSLITTSRDTSVNKEVKVVYSDSVLCLDGKRRNGEIVLRYSSVPATDGAKFYRMPSYNATVTLNNYWVDGWLVDDVTPLMIKNIMPVNYNPAADVLKWEYSGNLLISKPGQPEKDITWIGKFNKTLSNSTNNLVFNPSKNFAIQWSTIYAAGSGSIIAPGAKIEYTGESSGTVPGGIAYTFKIDETSPLVKEFSCSPDKVTGITTSTTVPITIYPVYSERHPFINGVATFTPGSKAPRKLEFGLEGTAACDDAGTVTIKGVSYPIDFDK